MKRHLSLIILVCCVLGMTPESAWAQLSFSARLKTTRTVLYEPVILTVEFRNETSRPVTLDDGTGPTLSVDIESSPGRYIRQVEPLLLGEPVLLPPRETVKRTVNLTQSFEIRDAAPYTIRARVTWDGQVYSSGVAFLDVVPGLELLRRQGPAAPDGSGSRLYRVLSLNRDRGEHAFLRIDDERAGICYGVLHLGRLVRVQSPKLEIDDQAQVHVLHQAGPAQYMLHVFTPNGRLVVRKLYSAEGAVVDLAPGPDGRIIVTGASASRTD